MEKIEILKALYIDAKILIMDEPTAVLTPQETDNLLLFIKEFTKKGNSVIFITHKLKEVIAVADRVIVMRTGKNVAEVKKGNFDENVLSNLMIGKDIAVEVKKEKTNIQDKKEVLKLENVSFISKNGVKLLDNISFSIHEGEVFGIAGVSGNGQDEVCDIIAGVKKIKEGKVYFSDECVNSLSIKERNERGMGYVPLDRYRDAMVMDMTLAENMLLKHAFDKSWFKHGFIINKAKLDNYTKEAIKNHLINISNISRQKEYSIKNVSYII
jgi:simple sugar transport system ATP-binding protein